MKKWKRTQMKAVRSLSSLYIYLSLPLSLSFTFFLSLSLFFLSLSLPPKHTRRPCGREEFDRRSKYMLSCGTSLASAACRCLTMC
jgi:hypothetical protein